MKKVILNIAGLLCSLMVFAQTGEGTHESSPRVSKGYYSIGNNAQKLKDVNGVRFTTSEAASTEINKGYYSVERNQKKLNRQKIVMQSGATNRAVPVVTKGYYSIGNNARKLQK